jgi:GTP-binding protein
VFAVARRSFRSGYAPDVLYDRVRISVEAGAGGNGCVSFRREAHVARGGPDGGDGGRGGDVIVLADPDLRDLSFFRSRRRFRAGRGSHGQGAQRTGGAGEALVLRVPVGTIVQVEQSGTRHDLTEPGGRAVVARGGAGGSGNRRFATSTRQAPRFAELGLAGAEATLELRLKQLADVGIVGAPNAGKSSLLRRLTRARPKVGDYPFTTIEPALGTLEDDEGRQLVLADIPGLIEGAGAGAGLGHEFLAHVERTRLLVHLVDVAPLDGSDPWTAFETVRRELADYGADLEVRPFLVALGKVDLLPPEMAPGLAAEWQRRLADDPHVRRERDRPLVLGVSSVTGVGAERLGRAIFANTPSPEPSAADGGRSIAEHAVYRPHAADGFSVARSGDHVFRITGSTVERLVGRHDLENRDALEYIEERLRTMGVVKELESQGFEPGDEIEIGEVAFALYPGVPQPE